MLIYIVDNAENSVILKLIDCDYAFVFGAFVEKYGNEIKCDRVNVYITMKDIDNWYLSTFKEGCVRFEFD